MNQDSTKFNGPKLEQYAGQRGQSWWAGGGCYYTHDEVSGLVTRWDAHGDSFQPTGINGGFHTPEQAKEQVEKDHIQRWTW